MKKLLFFTVLGAIGICANAQTPTQVFNGLLYEYNNGHSVKGSLFIPRDTLDWTGTKGRQGRIAYKAGLFYFHDSIRNRQIAFADESINFFSIISPLLAESPSAIQPTDSLIVALGKLQAQLNNIDGKYVENQNSSYQTAVFKINGTGEIKADAGPLRIARGGSGLGKEGLIYYNNESGTQIGHIGLGESTARDFFYVSNLRSGMYNTVADSSIWFWRTYHPTEGAKPYSSWKRGRLLLSDTAFSNAGLYNDTAKYPLEIRNASGHSAVFSKSIIADQVGVGTFNPARKLVISNNGAEGIEIDPTADGTPSILWYNRLTSAFAVAKLRASEFQFLEGSVGIGISPTSTLYINGSVGSAFTTTTTTITLDLTHHFVNVNNGSDIIINLPDATLCAGREYYIKKISNNANTITIDPNGSQTVDLNTTDVIGSFLSSRKYVSDGSNWWVF